MAHQGLEHGKFARGQGQFFAALLQHPLSQAFVVRVSVILISWYGDKGPFGVFLWTTTSARMPEGPNTRTLSFSSSALRPAFLASQHTTRRTASCHKLNRYASFMQEIAWFPKRSTTFTFSGQSLTCSKEDLWHRAHLKFSLTGWDVCKRRISTS